MYNAKQVARAKHTAMFIRSSSIVGKDTELFFFCLSRWQSEMLYINRVMDCYNILNILGVFLAFKCDFFQSINLMDPVGLTDFVTRIEQ